MDSNITVAKTTMLRDIVLHFYDIMSVDMTNICSWFENLVSDVISS